MRLVISSLRAIVLIAAAGLCGCDALSERRLEPDAAWHKRALVDGHLAHWLVVAPSESGFLNSNVSRTWQRRPQPTTDIVTQARQVYVLLSGFELTGDRRYLDGARRGADFLLRHFRDPLYGGYFRVVATEGSVVTDGKLTYGNAFAIFALSHAYRVTKDERYREAALNAWRAVSYGLKDSTGGFRLSAPRDFGPSSEARVFDPMMHLFEAVLALHEATGEREALVGVRAVGDFMLSRMLVGRPDGTAYFPEWYNDRWEPLTQDGGGYTDLGHNLGMAYLLDVAGARGLSPVYSAAALRVLDYSIKVGYDEAAGGCYSRSFPDGTVARDKGWWQQSECLRALMHFGALYDKPDMNRRYEQTLAFVREEFIDAANGGWYLYAKSACARSPCPDEQPDAYHMVSMHREAMDLAARAKSSH